MTNCAVVGLSDNDNGPNIIYTHLYSPENGSIEERNTKIQKNTQ